MDILLLILSVLGSAAVAFLTAKWSAYNSMTKLREEMKLDYSIETAIRHLLENPNYKKRSLKKIKHHLRGFRDDNELRMALMRAGAVAFSGTGDEEQWGLLSRNPEDVK
ncbi:hypothetical protein PVW51_15195 [Sulfitobacter sp. PR48]|uniref:hypothetical protein n=1 Tax=Sulfitobacter sp. PR48 TaxID=3028383 RepID=UPI00237AB1B9|nr:hypothetical protein [Sulfitobacter sp. PR48]MDD9722051.1 hypothetical protein [Sulfitobacter sp. PR48]